MQQHGLSQRAACRAVALSRSVLAYTPRAADDELLIAVLQGRPMQNGCIERLNRSYREAVLNMYVFKTLEEVRERTEAWITDYNEVLPHDALGDLTPAECRVLHHPETSRIGWH